MAQKKLVKINLASIQELNNRIITAEKEVQDYNATIAQIIPLLNKCDSLLLKIENTIISTEDEVEKIANNLKSLGFDPDKSPEIKDLLSKIANKLPSLMLVNVFMEDITKASNIEKF